MMRDSVEFAFVGIFLFVLFLFFLMGRELICWYFKINRKVQLLENILAELRSQNEKTEQK